MARFYQCNLMLAGSNAITLKNKQSSLKIHITTESSPTDINKEFKPPENNVKFSIKITIKQRNTHIREQQNCQRRNIALEQ